MIRGIRGNPHGELSPHETLQPEQVAFLIKRPAAGGGRQLPEPPGWLRLLRALFSGVYTVDNMDFVLRDSYMSGHGPQAFDLNRLLHYSFFTAQGLTLHAKGLSALERFVEARDKLFRHLYFHRTVRAIDLALKDLFGPTMNLLFPGNPLEHLDAYRRLTDWSMLADVARGSQPIGTAARQNFIYEPATSQVRPLGPHDLFARLPVSFSLCRLYTQDHAHDADLTTALDRLLQARGDDKTNM